MSRLTVKQKFAATFSLYLLVLLIFFCVIFFVIYQYLIKRQIDNTLFSGINSVISRHIFFEGEELKLRLDDGGKTLKEYLLSESISAMIFDRNSNVYKSYGVFALMDTEHHDWPKFINLVMEKTSREKLATFDYPLTYGKMTILSVPLKYQDKTLGVLVLGKSWEEYNQAKQTIVLASMILGVFGILGSFLLGHLLADYAFKPISQIIKTMEGVDLEKLNKTIQIKGNPGDEMVHLSRKINAMFLRLKGMAQNQKDYLLHASHELKRPMTKAVSALDLIALKERSSVEKIIAVRDDLMEVNNLLDHLLSLTPLNRSNLPQGNSNISQVVDKVIAKFHQEVEAKNITVQKIIDPKIIVGVPQSGLFIILENVISNCIKYSGSDKTVKVTAKSTPNLSLEIEDQGIGLNQEEVKKVFDKFYRTDQAKMTNSGFGLGLSIVKQVCDLYKVRILLTSQVGEGTKVELIFS